MDQESEALVPDRAGGVVLHLTLQLPAMPRVKPALHANATIHPANDS